MRVDFYQLRQSTAEDALPLIARATMNAGERLLVVSAEQAQLDRIDAALWSRQPDTFLAHGKAGDAHEARQPILLSREPAPANGARFLAIADGLWRDADAAFDRVFYFFDDVRLQDARDCWRMLGTRDEVDRRFWKQEDGKWVEGP